MGVLLPDAAKAFRKLKDVRNRRAIHFDPATDEKDREFALEAVKSLNEIISVQFGTLPPKAWFIPGIESGGNYIKKEMEKDPFVKLVYLPNALLVGPDHYVEGTLDGRWRVFDAEDYEDRDLSDEEFGELLKKAQEERFAKMREVREDADVE